jgi:hypothetical protein
MVATAAHRKVNKLQVFKEIIIASNGGEESLGSDFKKPCSTHAFPIKR